jgi:ribosomal protein S18 acetylase RimI-like enzyme
MSNPELIVRRADDGGRDDDAVTGLMFEYLQWALAMMAREHVVFPGTFDSRSVRNGLGAYRPPRGRLLIAELHGSSVGVGALRRLRDDSVEIKRMYVRPEARGRHVGSRILDGLIEEAQSMNARTILLDSAWFMTQAQGLYKSRGFLERSPYEGTEIPVNIQSRWRFFEKRF